MDSLILASRSMFVPIERRFYVKNLSKTNTLNTFNGDSTNGGHWILSCTNHFNDLCCIVKRHIHNTYRVCDSHVYVDYTYTHTAKMSSFVCRQKWIWRFKCSHSVSISLSLSVAFNWNRNKNAHTLDVHSLGFRIEFFLGKKNIMQSFSMLFVEPS